MLKEYELQEVNIANPYVAVLRPPEIEHIFSVTNLPCLRDLRLSFRGLQGTHLFDVIAETFPLLEVLELHAETGPGCIWQMPQLVCARQASLCLCYPNLLRYRLRALVLYLRFRGCAR